MGSRVAFFVGSFPELQLHHKMTTWSLFSVQFQMFLSIMLGCVKIKRKQEKELSSPISNYLLT